MAAYEGGASGENSARNEGGRTSCKEAGSAYDLAGACSNLVVAVVVEDRSVDDAVFLTVDCCKHGNGCRQVYYVQMYVCCDRFACHREPPESLPRSTREDP